MKFKGNGKGNGNGNGKELSLLTLPERKLDILRLPHAPHNDAPLPNPRRIRRQGARNGKVALQRRPDHLLLAEHGRFGLEGPDQRLLAERGGDGDGPADSRAGDETDDGVVAGRVRGGEVGSFEAEAGAVFGARSLSLGVGVGGGFGRFGWWGEVDFDFVDEGGKFVRPLFLESFVRVLFVHDGWERTRFFALAEEELDLDALVRV